jgi:hypothetical protein
MEVTLYGWKLLVLIDARTKIPLAAQVVPIQEHETLCLRALVTQARTNVGGKARRHKVVFDRGFLDGADLWWLDPHGITCVVPPNTTLAVTVDARAQAAAGAEITVVRQWQGKDDGPGGNTVFLTNASVEEPLRPFADDDDLSLIEHCGLKEAKQPWELGHPPQKTGQAVRVHMVFTLVLLCSTGYARTRPQASPARVCGWRGHARLSDARGLL